MHQDGLWGQAQQYYWSYSQCSYHHITPVIDFKQAVIEWFSPRQTQYVPIKTYYYLHIIIVQADWLTDAIVRMRSHTHTHRQKRWVIGYGSLPEPISERYNGAKLYKPKRYHSYVLYCVDGIRLLRYIGWSLCLHIIAKPIAIGYSHRRYLRLLCLVINKWLNFSLDFITGEM